MDIVKELTRLHGLAGETTLLNFRALMQEELRKLIEQAQDEAAQQSVQRTCANCGADDWRDAIVPDTLEICNRCGASR